LPELTRIPVDLSAIKSPANRDALAEIARLIRRIASSPEFGGEPRHGWQWNVEMSATLVRCHPDGNLVEDLRHEEGYARRGATGTLNAIGRAEDEPEHAPRRHKTDTSSAQPGTESHYRPLPQE
jgi:hypothetical protein